MISIAGKKKTLTLLRELQSIPSFFSAFFVNWPRSPQLQIGTLHVGEMYQYRFGSATSGENVLFFHHLYNIPRKDAKYVFIYIIIYSITTSTKKLFLFYFINLPPFPKNNKEIINLKQCPLSTPCFHPEKDYQTLSEG